MTTEFFVDIKKETLSSDNSFYLGLGEEAYKDGFDYARGDAIVDRIRLLLKDVPGSNEARARMAMNVDELGRRLAEKSETEQFDEFLKNTIKQILLDVSPPENRIEVEKLLAFMETKGQLFPHLNETGDSSVAFFGNIDNILSENSEAGLFKKRHVDLMEFVARTHDLPKLLGGLNAQIDPDHEVIYREVICKHLVGKNFKTARGEVIIFDQADVDFIKQVAGKHEDIWREGQFAKQVKSLEKPISATNGKIETVAEEVYVERARCIFHFLDIFGNAVRFDNNVLTIVDSEAFKARFIDLYQRHIKLPIVTTESGIVDWTKGKVNRAEWGLHGVTGLTWTFEALESWGVKVDPELIIKVQEGIMGVLKQAKSDLRDSLKSQQRYVPGETSKNNLRRNYRKVAKILADLKNEIDK